MSYLVYSVFSLSSQILIRILITDFTLNNNLQKFLYFIILIAGAAWIWFSTVDPGSTTSGAIPAPQEGFLAPDFTLDSKTGESISLSDFRGQPVLINIWASWCAPCRAEMPAMQRAYEVYQDQGFTILAVNATNQDNPDRAITFADELGLNFPILMDYSGEVSESYHVRALPSSFFVNEHGIIQEVVIGGPMSEALLITRIENLIEEAD